MNLISFMKNITINFCSTLEYKTIICYIFIGSAFTTAQYAGLSYMEIFMCSFINKIFLIVILYPSFIAMFITIYRYINENPAILLRLKNRVEYAKYSIFSVIFMSLFLLIHIIIILAICCNMTPNIGFHNTKNFGYNINDFAMFLIFFFKITFTIFTIGLLNLTLMFKNSKKNISLIVLMTFLLILFFGDKVYPSGSKILDTFNPSFHSHGFALESNVMFIITSGFTYFICIFTLLITLIFKSSKATKLGMVCK